MAIQYSDTDWYIRGKVGDVVGCTWKDKMVLRTKPTKTIRKSEAQLAWQRQYKTFVDMAHIVYNLNGQQAIWNSDSGTTWGNVMKACIAAFRDKDERLSRLPLYPTGIQPLLELENVQITRELDSVKITSNDLAQLSESREWIYAIMTQELLTNQPELTYFRTTTQAGKNLFAQIDFSGAEQFPQHNFFIATTTDHADVLNMLCVANGTYYDVPFPTRLI